MDLDDARGVIREQHRAVLATTRDDGTPQMSPVLVAVDDEGCALVSTRETAVKTRNLRRDPRSWLCVLPDGFFGRWVQVEGHAEIISLPEAMDGLEDYYRRLGYPGQANMFFRAQKQREREEVLTGFPRAWSYFLDWFVGYGRSPQRAIFWSVAIVGIGCLVFRPKHMEPQNSEHSARKYSAFWYSVDVYVPIIKLHDAEIWKPPLVRSSSSARGQIPLYRTMSG